MFPRTIQSKKNSKNRAPWITRELLHKMRVIDLINEIAVSSDDYAVWEKFKRARNQANIFFFYILEASRWNPRKVCNFINELRSRT